MMSSRKPNAAKPESSSRPIIKLSAFARNLLREWKRLNLPLARASVLVAVSGGADSVALLTALDELSHAKKLGVKIVVAHLNHQLRGKASGEDARWVTSLAKRLGYRARIKSANVLNSARKSSDNLEQAARRARYQFLADAAKTCKAPVVLVAHTLNDQAETVLLNLLRGSGTTGLGGIDAVRPIRTGSEIVLVRPLLSWARRSDTESYCRDRGLEFRRDAMNEDEAFARVRVRKRLIPLLNTFNPKFVESVARTAEILREDDAALEKAAERLLELSLAGDSLRPDLLRFAQPALRRRALRRWISSSQGDLRRLEHAHVLALEKFLFNTSSGRVIELPGGARVVRSAGLFVYQKRAEKRRR